MKEGRVTQAHRTNFLVKSQAKELTATVRGSFHDEGEFPKVGDYVTYSVLDDGQAVIEQIRPRTSVIKRRSATTDQEQIMVANVNLIVIVMGLDGDYSINRLERYLLLAEQSAIPAVIVLNKTDVTHHLEEQLQAVEAVAGPTRVIPTSAQTGQGMIALKDCFTAETTAVLLGSSGAGKSTITNWLLGEAAQRVASTRAADNRGRHTTTARQLFGLPFGGYLIDTPGLRELGVMEDESAAQNQAFATVAELAQRCQFRNCDHEKSTGCAVLAAVAAGEIHERQYQNYQKLKQEQALASDKGSSRAQRHSQQTQKRSLQQAEALRRKKLQPKDK